MRKIMLTVMLLMVSCQLLPAGDKKAKARKPKTPAPISGVFKNQKAAAATQKLGKTFWSAIDRYYKSLAFARSVATRKTDVAETGRIEDALAGQSVDDFTSSSAKSARRIFLANLESACKSYGYQLKSALREILRAGDQEQAEQIQAVLDAIDHSRVANTRVRRTTTVYANKDWQGSGVEVRKGTAVTISASGSWSPGTRKKVGRQKWEVIYGDADTYNLQSKIGTKNTNRGGKSWRFTAHQDGEIFFRMAPYRWRGKLGEAKGSLRVKVHADLLASKETRSLEEVVRSLVPAREELATGDHDRQKAEAPAQSNENADHAKPAAPLTPKPSIHTATLKATRTWQDMVIDVPAGATVRIQADGEWSPGMRKIKQKRHKRFKRLRGTADDFNLEAMVAATAAGSGGSAWSFNAPNQGVLYLRMAKSAFRRVKGEPEGALTLKITIEPAQSGN